MGIVFSGGFIESSQKGPSNATLDQVDDTNFIRVKLFSTGCTGHFQSPWEQLYRQQVAVSIEVPGT
jgi:hypothetical protein